MVSLTPAVVAVSACLPACLCSYLALQVPGLAEARPSVLRGDALYVSLAGAVAGSREWEGVVHIVQKEEVRNCPCCSAASGPTP
jgi:hypothetical protein